MAGGPGGRGRPPVRGLQRRGTQPATFKDRLLLRTNPYQVLEGLAIAAYAVGAERAYVGLKEAFTPEVQALSRALGEMREADALGGVAVEIVLGPDLYLFGEETGMEEVIEGRPPLPRVARPYIQGLLARPPEDNPTLVNNVETLANVPHILADGADWLRANGTDVPARWSSPSAGTCARGCSSFPPRHAAAVPGRGVGRRPTRGQS